VGLVERIRVVIPYTPRAQFVDFHARHERWACIVAHRRAGKTVACINELIKAALLCNKPDPRFAYLAPYYTQAKDVAWNYLKKFSAVIPGVETNESELRVDFPNGGRVRLYGADNYDRMRGLYLDGVVLDEPADMDPRAWAEVVRPALSDRQGWATFIGTPKGRNGFHAIWENAGDDPAWFRAMLRASETGLVALSELEDARKAMTPEQYEQEYECSFDAAILGSYYGKDIAEAARQNRIREIAYDPEMPVHTAWDLGMGDSTAIWFFQVAPDGVRFIDHYENHSQPLGHYAGVLAAKPYKYADDWVPHDAKVRELGTGRTRVETLKSLGRKPRLVPDHKLMDGINAARVGFSRFWFDEVNCRLGLEALRQYRTEFDEKTKAYKDNPKHDWTSHTADAFRYAAMAWKEMKPEPTVKDVMAELLRPKTLNEILAEHDAEQDD
jgi:phage terminase large subunit